MPAVDTYGPVHRACMRSPCENAQQTYMRRCAVSPGRLSSGPCYVAQSPTKCSAPWPGLFTKGLLAGLIPMAVPTTKSWRAPGN